MEERIRVVIGKPGLDGHDRGAKVVSRALRDAGMEVIYTGIRQTPSEIVETAIEEDADIIGLSILSGAHIRLSSKLIDKMKEKHVENIPVFLGGIIPEDDIPELKNIGIAEVFGPGTPLELIIQKVRDIVLGKKV
ncbi:cobalamin B12-binding domain-containing protein [Geotoga petraea]|jgi:methylmalonyl-CoA mutase C-terminal domain/subunit|uniref:Cobalamin B12-binding domain-containing protein n=1 Tax=Geotoga petraea TaxID=28234 RepID=A0A1G6MPU1_9BACT|nr:cobalamin B12-binding domain-containing protein [Geotoga petraea]TGG87388.1 cobalamin B12-binding domain-containing protein [Geotoga petraea]SDC57532.1 methylmalonyl-CoA mutase, C-terminal domain [Geotoga petraea]